MKLIDLYSFRAAVLCHSLFNCRRFVAVILWQFRCRISDQKILFPGETGESIMDVVSRAGKVEFDKYWLEKFDQKPPDGKIIGVIQPRDLEKKTGKLKKLKSPQEWSHGQFNAMIQEFGFSRHVCWV